MSRLAPQGGITDSCFTPCVQLGEQIPQSETVNLDGHIVDLLTFSKVLDQVLLSVGTDQTIVFRIDATRADP